MSVTYDYEETPHFAKISAPSVEDFITEVDFLKELAEGEITVQTIFVIKQTLQRLGIQSSALRPEATSHT